MLKTGLFCNGFLVAKRILENFGAVTVVKGLLCQKLRCLIHNLCGTDMPVDRHDLRNGFVLSIEISATGNKVMVAHFLKLADFLANLFVQLHNERVSLVVVTHGSEVRDTAQVVGIQKVADGRHSRKRIKVSSVMFGLKLWYAYVTAAVKLHNQCVSFVFSTHVNELFSSSPTCYLQGTGDVFNPFSHGVSLKSKQSTTDQMKDKAEFNYTYFQIGQITNDCVTSKKLRYITVTFKATLNGPRQANLLLIAYASSEGSGEPAHPRSLARTFAARSYKQ